MYPIGLEGKPDQLPSVQFIYLTYIVKMWAVSDAPLFANLQPFWSISSSFPRVLPWSKRLETTTGAGSSLLTLFPCTPFIPGLSSYRKSSKRTNYIYRVKDHTLQVTPWLPCSSGLLFLNSELVLVTPFGLGACIQALTPYHGSLNSFAPECLSV